jgi:carboxymethylenebutenolidase
MLTYDALHAFANPSNPNYDEKSAAAAWEEVRKFFAEKLKAKK